jgi:hypothetical protein
MAEEKIGEESVKMTKPKDSRRKPIFLITFLMLLFVILTLFFPGQGSADPSMQWASLATGADGNGNLIYTMVYGYYVNVGSETSNVFIQCDVTTGKETGPAYVADLQVGTINQQEQVPQVTYQLDPVQTHKLYAVENFPGMLWKGDVNLEPYWAASNQLSAVCPYTALPDSWRWMIYQFDNENSWPVAADITNGGLSGVGETWTGYEPFSAGQTKYLRLMLNANLNNQSVANNFWTVANTHQNLDPLAPPIPPAARNYITDPEADDSSGINWSADEWEGLTFNGGSSSYYTSQAFWALQPGFIQEPSWVPNPGEDAHWGTIQWNSVPGYVWVKQPGFSIQDYGSGLIDASGMPGMPYVVGGGYGPLQSSKPSGPSTPAYSWNQESWKYDGGYGTIAYPYGTAWGTYVSQHWPHYQNIGGTDPMSFLTCGASGYFYENPGVNQHIIYWAYGFAAFDWWENVSNGSSSGVDLGSNITLPSCPANGKQNWLITPGNPYTDPSISLQSVTPGYEPISGSYDQVQSVNWYVNHYTGGTYVQNLEVCNPGPDPVTFNLTQGIENTDTYYGYHYSIGAPQGGQVTIQPGQSAWLTSTYSLPQNSTDGDGFCAPKAWYYWNGAGYTLDSDFDVGSTRPINVPTRVFSWTASGIKNNCVGYDYGECVTDGTVLGAYGFNCSPGFYGSLLSYVNAMTPSEITNFQGYSSVAEKVQSVESSGYATWTAQSDMYIKSGYISYVSAS